MEICMRGVCVQLGSLQGMKAQEFTFGACPLEVLEGPLIYHQFLSYPYNKPQHVVCPRNKPIKMGILTISPFGYFVTKPPLT